jgi:hypothetical protein
MYNFMNNKRDIVELCHFITERFDVSPVAPPINLGQKIYNPRNGISSVIIGTYWDINRKDWQYLVVDECWATPPLWVSNKQLHCEMGVFSLSYELD